MSRAIPPPPTCDWRVSLESKEVSAAVIQDELLLQRQVGWMVCEHLFSHFTNDVNVPLLIARLEVLDAKLPSLLTPHHHLGKDVGLSHVSAYAAPNAKDVPVVAGGTERSLLRLLRHGSGKQSGEGRVLRRSHALPLGDLRSEVHGRREGSCVSKAAEQSCGPEPSTKAAVFWHR